MTRATVYRRFPDKTRLLIADLEQLLSGWSAVVADPWQRRLLRRIYGAIEDQPELARTYQDLFGRHRDQARRHVFARARDSGHLLSDADPDVLLDLLTGAIWQHLATRPDYLRAVLHQARLPKPSDEPVLSPE